MDPLQRRPHNQAVPLVDHDVAAEDQALQEGLAAFAGPHADEIRTSLHELGMMPKT